MFTKSGSIQRESVQLNTVSVDHFFQCVKEEKEDDLRNYFRDPNYKVWLLKEENDYTALHRAVFNNSERIVLLIIDELKKRIGFESKIALTNFINEKTNEGITALHDAAYKGNIEIAKLLIQNGVIVELVTNRNNEEGQVDSKEEEHNSQDENNIEPQVENNPEDNNIEPNQVPEV